MRGGGNASSAIIKELSRATGIIGMAPVDLFTTQLAE